MLVFSRFILVGLLIASLSGCEQSRPEASLLESIQAPIVGGDEVESGWDAIGALVLVPIDQRYIGHFCSATLIRPQWVLTAAHCVTGDGGFDPTPLEMGFFIGNVANTSDSQPPKEGRLIMADAIYANPSYGMGWNEDAWDDVALVHLREPVLDIAPIPMNTEPMTQDWIGREVTYVGFGATEGISHSGAGIKRIGVMTFFKVGNFYYKSKFENQGVCYGDSGGPGLVERDGQWYVVGVNSALDYNPIGGEDDPCLSNGIQMRVDSYVPWVEEIMASPPTDCRNDKRFCLCGDACGEDGVCRDFLCPGLSCGWAMTCRESCGESEACLDRCDDETAYQSSRKAWNLVSCMNTKCSNPPLDAEECIEQYCTAQQSSCDQDGFDQGGCFQGFHCARACAEGDNLCLDACLTDLELGAGQASTRLLSCLDTWCFALEGSDQRTCQWNTCKALMGGCGLGLDCRIGRGDCGEEAACLPFSPGHNICYPSLGLALGDPCTASENPVPCEDGMICRPDQGVDRCLLVCTSDVDCGEGESCVLTSVDSGPLDRTCRVCDDLDGDGFCNDLDCDEDQEFVHPGAYELCWDGIDNDCDGQVDEACDSCVDHDQDGSCEGDDCNDEDPDVHQGQAEICGDGIDNDCNHAIDEQCSMPVCRDLDKDGYCEAEDCDDQSALVNPGSQEVCGDGLDNNCDGVVDEGCSISDADLEIVEEVDAGDGGQVKVPSGGCTTGVGNQAFSGLVLLLLAMVGIISRLYINYSALVPGHQVGHNQPSDKRNQQ